MAAASILKVRKRIWRQRIFSFMLPENRKSKYRTGRSFLCRMQGYLCKRHAKKLRWLYCSEDGPDE
jgi:hypothetical protein